MRGYCSLLSSWFWAHSRSFKSVGNRGSASWHRSQALFHRSAVTDTPRGSLMHGQAGGCASGILCIPINIMYARFHSTRGSCLCLDVCEKPACTQGGEAQAQSSPGTGC